MPRSQQPKEGELIVVSRLKVYNKILDIGAGDGKWAELLPDKRLDAVEIWPEYVKKYNLQKKYKNLYIINIINFVKVKDITDWEVVILGDVLEHLDKEFGVELVSYLKCKKVKVFLIIPISGDTRQNGTCYGNPYETHRSFWTREEILSLGFTELHFGLNENGKVGIGTYEI